MDQVERNSIRIIETYVKKHPAKSKQTVEASRPSLKKSPEGIVSDPKKTAKAAG
ncbi:hypothetical protein Psch_02606 [Pelotomaculum schinkii]|uniref:Uncharacterized protein n=1 Tax=Pelotomaculum schinkii TaxID=78350 RepID=A0A4Y7R9D6_9FIRM|nr:MULTISPECIES: hypothetical protein [Pelotomaculum]TEB05565.1 hypothetical protein Psch_02606 [Pelotomaculum schinkii]TEB11212.1 hypothetical protein Psfp_04009 [Pelotomaculum sp. FP]